MPSRAKKSPLTIQIEYYPVRALFGLLKTLPRSWAAGLSRGVLGAILRFMPRRRALVDQQIAACFPERTPAQRQAIARQSLDYLAAGIALYPRIPDAVRRRFEGLVETEGFEHLEQALRQGRGAITFTAHFGFWEMMAVYVTRIYPKVSMLVRPLDNPKLDELVTGVRSSGGGGVIDSRRVFKDGLRLLRSNGILGILIDQNFHKGGVFVDFFGRLAATNTLGAILARRTGCALLPMHNVWRGGKICIICEPPLQLSRHADRARALWEDTQAMTRCAERWIRADPGQWLWLHNRWKRRPTEEERRETVA